MTIYASLGVGSGSGSSTFAPNTTIQEFDDFVSSTSDSAWYVGKISWQNNSHRITGAPGVAGHDGLLTTDGGAGLNSLTMNVVSGSPPFILGSGTLSVNWIINIGALSNAGNRYQLFVGTSDINSAEPNNGCYFSYSDNVNAGNWVLTTANGAVRTAQNTTTAAATGWVNLGVNVDATAANVTYFINGTQVGTAVTTNIPTVAIGSAFIVNPTAGVLPTFLLDMMYYTRTFTTAR